MNSVINNYLKGRCTKVALYKYANGTLNVNTGDEGTKFSTGNLTVNPSISVSTSSPFGSSPLTSGSTISSTGNNFSVTGTPSTPVSNFNLGTPPSNIPTINTASLQIGTNNPVGSNIPVREPAATQQQNTGFNTYTFNQETSQFNGQGGQFTGNGASGNLDMVSSVRPTPILQLPYEYANDLKTNLRNATNDLGITVENPSNLIPYLNDAIHTTPYQVTKNPISWVNKGWNLYDKAHNFDLGLQGIDTSNISISPRLSNVHTGLGYANKAFSWANTANRFSEVAGNYSDPVMGSIAGLADYGLNQAKKYGTDWVKDHAAQTGVRLVGTGLEHVGGYLGSRALTSTGTQLLNFVPEAGLMVDAALLGYDIGSTIAPYTSVPLAKNMVYTYYGGDESKYMNPVWEDDEKYSYAKPFGQQQYYSFGYNPTGRRNYALEAGRTWYSDFLTPQGRYAFDQLRAEVNRNPDANLQWTTGLTESEALQRFLILHPEYQTDAEFNPEQMPGTLWDDEAQQSFLNPTRTNERFDIRGRIEQDLEEQREQQDNAYYEQHPEEIYTKPLEENELRQQRIVTQSSGENGTQQQKGTGQRKYPEWLYNKTYKPGQIPLGCSISNQDWRTVLYNGEPVGRLGDDKVFRPYYNVDQWQVDKQRRDLEEQDQITAESIRQQRAADEQQNKANADYAISQAQAQAPTMVFPNFGG